MVKTETFENIDPMSIFSHVEPPPQMTDMLALLLSKDGIETKTEIVNPNSLAVLRVIADTLTAILFVKSSNTLSNYIMYLNEFMVSHKRKGRIEYKDAFQSLNSMQTEVTTVDRLTKNLKDL